MPEYPSAQALLADAHLRLDAFGSSHGVLVVEGHDDKRLFYGRVLNPAQLFPTGGRTLLLSAFAAASPSDRDKILFLTDCDYEVRTGDLAGAHGLVITAGTDIEADLLGLGVLSRIVAEVVPSALHNNQVERVSARVLEMATELALPVGRIRMAAKPLGVNLDLDHLEFSKYRTANGRGCNVEKLLTVTGERLRAAGVTGLDWPKIVSATPNDRGMCQGKDLLRAIRTVLIHEYRVDKEATVDVLSWMLRLAVHPSDFERWAVIRRIRQWEGKTGRGLLSEPSV